MAGSILLYVTADDVIERMQLNPSLPGISDVVESAIQAAQLHVESVLSAKITPHTVDARYFLDSEAFSGIQVGGMFRLEIPNGFIRSDVPLTITYDYKMTLPNPQVVDPALAIVDSEGYLLLDADTYRDTYVRVQCTTGINSGEPLPDDMYEAIMSYVATILDASQNTNRDAEAEPQYKKAADHSQILLNKYTRLKGFSFRPLYAKVVAV